MRRTSPLLFEAKIPGALSRTVKALCLRSILIAAVFALQSANFASAQLNGNGEAWCWSGKTNPPVCEIPSNGWALDTPPVLLCVGTFSSVIVGMDGSIVGWGHNDHGLLDISPDLLQHDSSISDMSMGQFQALACCEDGRIFAWGSNFNSVPLGLGTPKHPVVDVACGWTFNLALTANGDIFCWDNEWDENCDIPVSARDPANPPVEISSRFVHSAARLANGAVVCWGNNFYGECDVPLEIENGQLPVKKIVVGGSVSLALLEDGTVRQWGSEEFFPPPPSELQKPGYLRVVDISIGHQVGVAVLEDGSVRCWSPYSSGECDVPFDLQVPGPQINFIGSGSGHTTLIRGVVIDCDSNGIPDSEELATGDQNGDGILDSCQCNADLTLDGTVGSADMGILLALWGTDGSPNNSDLDGDGQVLASDLGILLGAWGPCP